jgi:ankyrin repeat protein
MQSPPTAACPFAELDSSALICTETLCTEILCPEEYQEIRTRLFAAIKYGEINTLQTILQSNLANIVNVEYGPTRLTPLKAAILFQKPIIALMLLKHGADVNHGNNNGRAAMHYVVDYGTVKIAKALIANGAKVDGYNLLQAIEQDKLDFALAFLSEGVDVNAIALNGQNLLSIVLSYTGQEKRRMRLVQALIRKGADVNHLDKMGWPPLAYALRPRRLEYVKLLIRKGANIIHLPKEFTIEEKHLVLELKAYQDLLKSPRKCQISLY